MFTAFGVLLDDVAQLGQPIMERCKVGFVVHGGFVHVVQYLLCDESVGSVIVIAVALLTLMEAIWQYVARVSFVLPMVR